jgi:hypothetical protein
VVLPGPDYLPAAGLTPCAFGVAVVVRLMAATHEPEAAWNELDGLVETAAAALGRWVRVDTGVARDVAGTTWLTADYSVTYTAERPPAAGLRR